MVERNYVLMTFDPVERTEELMESVDKIVAKAMDNKEVKYWAEKQGLDNGDSNVHVFLSLFRKPIVQVWFRSTTAEKKANGMARECMLLDDRYPFGDLVCFDIDIRTV